MQLWSGPSERFFRDTTQNQISGMLADAFFRHYHYNPSDGEQNSWRNSLRATSLAFRDAGLDDHGILLEYQLPLTSLRLDCMVCGIDDEGRDNAVIVELKQWEECEAAEGEHLITTWVGGANREKLHPSAQVAQYRRYLEDTHTAFYEEPSPIGLGSCAYLHNYSRDAGDPLFDPRFHALLADSPTFTMDDVEPLKTFLVARLAGGQGLPVLDRIQRSQFRASKKLMDHVAGVIDGSDDYVLLDEQLVIFDKVLATARQGLSRRGKRVLIVRGGPGTGKSVVALNLMSKLLREGYNAHYATGSRAFTGTLRSVIGPRGSVQFNFFNSFQNTEPDEIDVVICDEAHRLRATSFDRYRPGSRTGKPQVQEILEAAKLPVFFIDDRQTVRPDEVGSSTYIRDEAVRLGLEVSEYELETQFRCAGSDAYVNWVTNTLAIAPTANTIWEGDEKFDFQILPSPEALEHAIRQRAGEGFSARLTAGFCWRWSKQHSDGTLADDVAIGSWRRPWNAKHDATKLAKGIPKATLWAHDPGGIDQVGCVYTAQGFEFDYAGVVFGPDLRYDFNQHNWIGDPKRSFDPAVKRGRERFIDLVKNTYRVLLSRGMKGCYVHFMDADTESFVRTRIADGALDRGSLETTAQARSRLQHRVTEHPFRILPDHEVRAYENSLPLYDLAVAAGGFGIEQAPNAVAWVEVPDRRIRKGMFVAQVVGESMNRRIANGSYCLFQAIGAGSRQGKIVLAEHRLIHDAETAGHHTVKIYESAKTTNEEGSWQHETIWLRPDSSTVGFEPILVTAEMASELRIVAEFVDVLAKP